MNDVQQLTLSRGGPYTEASANTGPAISQHSRAGDITRTETVQVPRSPQPLSLQIDGLNARVYGQKDDALARGDSSERSSNTSNDPPRPELQSASTFTDSFSSLPLSSIYESSRSMEVDNSQTSNEDEQTPKTYSHYQEIPHMNGTGSVNGDHASKVVKKERNGSLSPTRSLGASELPQSNGMKFTPGHKRTATGDIKSISSLAVPDAQENGPQRRRSKTIGAPAHGSRIAQLSVHIRTRLSYAASKIEKSRQMRDSKTQNAIREIENLVSGNPPTASGAASTPGMKPSPYSKAPQSINNEPTFPTHQRSQSTMSSSKLLQIPKLAPPVDIISSNSDTTRRRPNPNPISKYHDHSPYARHRRHHSYQERSYPKLSSPVVGPGTPLIPPSSRMPLSAQHEFYKSNTQNSSMEQDAIETLIFMSSPENSGYRSNSRALQPPASQASLNESLFSNGPSQSQNSQSEKSHAGRSFELRPAGLGLEANAGDAIDRILDQMDSDSDDDARYASHRHKAYVPPYRGNRAPPG